MITRQEVFDAINAERDYQSRIWGVRQPDGAMKEAEHSVCDFVVYMQEYMGEAIRRASRESGNDGVLDELRKVVSLGVACFEQHGISKRGGHSPGTILNKRDGQPA